MSGAVRLDYVSTDIVGGFGAGFTIKASNEQLVCVFQCPWHTKLSCIQRLGKPQRSEAVDAILWELEYPIISNNALEGEMWVREKLRDLFKFTATTLWYRSDDPALKDAAVCMIFDDDEPTVQLFWDAGRAQGHLNDILHDIRRLGYFRDPEITSPGNIRITVVNSKINDPVAAYYALASLFF